MKRLNALLIMVIVVIAVFNIYMASIRNGSVVINFNNTPPTFTTTSYPPTNIIHGCTVDSDCQWTSVNCCSESAGAQWQCDNKQSYVDCLSKQVLCPQVVSSKPMQSCTCVNGVCRG